MARELAPAWVRSAHKIFRAASQPSGSKLPRHKKCATSAAGFSTENQGFAGRRPRQTRRHGPFTPRTLCGKRRHTLQFEPAAE
ncbi:hypothetical protein FHG55_18660 [Pseudomonas jessenii]|uniref:Uncharacterized protein n=1 Tax=Pseudomonas jessenii TaxID=77298 RepID=A0A5C4KV42_PSEJE|nr:hypothetical protein FHG55_18660 [Pseudomonas jessenii]